MCCHLRLSVRIMLFVLAVIVSLILLLFKLFMVHTPNRLALCNLESSQVFNETKCAFDCKDSCEKVPAETKLCNETLLSEVCAVENQCCEQLCSNCCSTDRFGKEVCTACDCHCVRDVNLRRCQTTCGQFFRLDQHVIYLAGLERRNGTIQRDFGTDYDQARQISAFRVFFCYYTSDEVISAEQVLRLETFKQLTALCFIPLHWTFRSLFPSFMTRRLLIILLTDGLFPFTFISFVFLAFFPSKATFGDMFDFWFFQCFMVAMWLGYMMFWWAFVGNGVREILTGRSPQVVPTSNHDNDAQTNDPEEVVPMIKT